MLPAPAALLEHCAVRCLDRLISVPRILKCLDLSGGLIAGLLGEQHVVRCVAVGRRIEIDKID